LSEEKQEKVEQREQNSFLLSSVAASPSSTSKARTSRNGWPAAGFAGRSSAHWNSEHERYLTAKRSCSQFQCALTARSAVGPANDLLLVAEIF
jgi:hypothetical protein